MIEEEFLERVYGETYRQHMARTGRYLPFHVGKK